MANKEPIRYIPSNSKDPYRNIMNSESVQRLLLNAMGPVQSQCIAQGIDASRDVQPGKMRAHARVSAKMHYLTYKRLDRVLASALDSCRL